jgi:L-asparaginase II
LSSSKSVPAGEIGGETAAGAGQGMAVAAAGVPLVAAVRGAFVESLHRGHAVAVTGDGTVALSLGAPDSLTFMRSAAKPFQALPLVASGAADRFGLTAREIAVVCGSHNAETDHREAVLSILDKIGLRVSDLKCGPHEPYGEQAARELRERGESPSAIHNNCSGKHAGMLALALHLGAPPETYDQAGGPVQREVFAAVSQFSGQPAAGLRFAVDGCGLPTFLLTVETMALMMARFAAPPPRLGEAIARGCRRIIEAMTAHPEMVEGECELDTELMRAGRGRFISKVGAEGLYAAGVLPCERWPAGLGLALKIEDGDRKDRARPVAAVALLRRLEVLSEEDAKAPDEFARSVTKNHRGEEVGEVRPFESLGPRP